MNFIVYETLKISLFILEFMYSTLSSNIQTIRKLTKFIFTPCNTIVNLYVKIKVYLIQLLNFIAFFNIS